VFVPISVTRSTSPFIFLLLFGLNQKTDKPMKKAIIAFIAHRNKHSTRGLSSVFTACSSGVRPSAMAESGATPPVRELLDMMLYSYGVAVRLVRQ
jgi:hypothetical protein